MIKQISLFKKRPDLDPGAFFDYWRNKHPAVVTQLPGLRQYVQSHSKTSDAPWDGMAEVWFDSIDDMRRNADCEELDRVREDERNFIDGNSMQSLICEEHVIVDGDPGEATVKIIILVPKLADVTAEKFQTVYRDEIGPMVQANPFVHRYVQAHCRLGFYRGDRKPVFDAISALWFADTDAQQQAFTHESLAPAPAMEATIMDNPGIGFMAVNEHRII
jgi:uncharacterized protein (TIGR02118 family)